MIEVQNQQTPQIRPSRSDILAKPSTKLVKFRVRESNCSLRRPSHQKTSIVEIHNKENHERPTIRKSGNFRPHKVHRTSIGMTEGLSSSTDLKGIGKRKGVNEPNKVLVTLLNSPVLSRCSIVRQLKCLMSNGSAHDSYLIPDALTRQIKTRLRRINDCQAWQFSYKEFSALVSRFEEKHFDTGELIECYQALVNNNKFPPSVQLMVLYLGVHLSAICACYDRAEDLAQIMLDLILRIRLDEYIPIYLLLMVRLKVGRADWKGSVQLLSRALASAWTLGLVDLQNWCYFEMSRAHFALNQPKDCAFFRQRAEMSTLQPQNSIFREMIVQEYKTEIETMRTHNYYFNLEQTIAYHQLANQPDRPKSQANLKVQLCAKSIASQCKIRHVKNLVNRLGEDLETQAPMTAAPQHGMAGNPQLLTHQSGIKNLNVYFRGVGKRAGRRKEKVMYTIENSSRNGLVLKEMARNLLMEMKYYMPMGQTLTHIPTEECD